jgi:hypothetical protein
VKWTDLTPLGQTVVTIVAGLALLMLMGIVGWIEGGMQ